MNRWGTLHVALVALGLYQTPEVVWAQNESPRLVILDLATAPSNSSLGNRVYSLSLDEITDSTMKRLIFAVHKDTCAGGGIAEALLSRVRNANALLSAQSSTRWISHKGDSTWIIVFHPINKLPQLSINEEARSSRITKDLATLIQVAQKISTSAMNAAEKSQPRCSLRRYSLSRTRATLKISTLLKDTPTGVMGTQCWRTILAA